MKRIVFAVALGLALAPSTADALCIETGIPLRCWRFCLSVHVTPGYCPCDYGPWYNSFPQHGHYYNPVAMYPHWPQQPVAMPAQAQMYNPYGTGYHYTSYYGGAPSYWYGR